MEEEKEKGELRSPHDTEAEVVAGAERVPVEALRATGVVGVAVDARAAAQQTSRTSRWSCGVCQAS